MPPETTQKEILYDGRVMITETDLNGIITFVNRKFVEMSGYSRDEVIGKPHSIIRHPDMPKACFEDMWQTLRSGQSWQGYVKNLRKDGAFYWVVVHISSKYENGVHTGYIAARKKPDRQAIAAIEQAYKDALWLEYHNNTSATQELIAAVSRKNAPAFPDEGMMF